MQVTKDCNFKCRYCIFANSELGRNHEKVDMSWDIAKKSIDFLFNYSKDSEDITIAFYGGEPLLNSELIGKVVKYVKETYKTKKITYMTTINGSLLTEKNINFLAEHNFNLTISFDGPVKIQNHHRKFFESGNEIFNVVFNNIQKIMKKHKDYFYENVKFLPVLFDDEEYQEILSFFKDIGVHQNQIIALTVDLTGIDYTFSDSKLIKTETINKKYDVFKTRENDLEKAYNDKSKIQSSWQHNGPCIPIKKLFIDVDGRIYPCERVIQSEELQIGNVDLGLDLKKIIKFMNLGKSTEEECKN